MKTTEREIKFRAWDFTKKEMHLPEYSDKEDFHVSAEGEILYTYESGYERHEQTSRRGKDWILMQFTGLLDKNGKELYFDSDIVKLDGYGEDLFTATKDDFGIPIFIRNNNVMDAQVTFQDHFLGSLTSTKSGFEIIGNIYQNTELLPTP